MKKKKNYSRFKGNIEISTSLNINYEQLIAKGITAILTQMTNFHENSINAN